MRLLCASILVLMAILLSPMPARAVQPDEVLANRALEERARTLSRDLRCMVCQNQSIDDSDAPLARDLRLLVRERLSAGDSDDQVLDFLVARYGEFVLLRPRFAASTAILWTAPFAVLIVGAVVVFLTLRRKRVLPSVRPLAADEQKRLDELTH